MALPFVLNVINQYIKNMENNLCAICNQPMKYIKAGISKNTGRSYNGFYACEIKEHKQPYNKPYNANNSQNQPTYHPAPQNAPRVANLAPQADIKPDWDAISRSKVRHGVAVAFIEKGRELNEQTKNEINAWTDFIMSGKAAEYPEGYQGDDPSYNEIPF